ncbi:PTS sugar transporter subunit IIA [Brachybacterium hainanense]|uniref:PTS sugar transporter subunit IIA n=1 Tax=Brachybacterium hainanense TaxID=1541174 RepID=A0ABV6RD82_9MICO
MPNILIAAHGDLSTALTRTAALIVGATDHVRCFEMTADLHHTDAEQQLTALVDAGRAAEERLLVLVDIQGGSPFNICSRLLLEHGDFDLVTGVNLPMLLEALTALDPPSGASLAAAGSAAITDISTLIHASEDNDD